ncbi:coiled-coil domain-containing protein [Actinomadura sp. CNU-125]|uniref:coiled-coil domain-containing protein n=1 Tax=Actinomadura sp. CNU-125 TaxID=1904961 RepID=UPI0021CCC777|nr:hypothetical protein [Actinomadura sp. CNU-125]
MPAGLALATALLVGASAVRPASASTAAPGPSAKVEQLTTKMKELEQDYGGRLEKLRDTRSQAADAVKKLRGLRSELSEGRALISRLAASRYMGASADPTMELVVSDEPGDLLATAALATHLSANQAARVRRTQTLVDRQREVGRDAEAKITELEREVAELAKERARVKALLKKYKPQSPLVGSGGMTARMIKVRNEIEAELGPFVTIGCTRPGDPQDHGSGRACDFMESSAGQMPSAERQAHGDRVAAYAVENADRLGIKYVIWRQRIYDVRSPGWRTMSDRGSVTQNHMDHNHISVF